MGYNYGDEVTKNQSMKVWYGNFVGILLRLWRGSTWMASRRSRVFHFDLDERWSVCTENADAGVSGAARQRVVPFSVLHREVGLDSILRDATKAQQAAPTQQQQQ